MAFHVQEFYVCSIPASIAEIHETINGKTIFDDYYLFIGFSAEELAMLAKKNKDAMKALESLLREDIQEFENRYCNRLDCPSFVIHTKFEECLASAVRKFDPRKGPFLHLFRAVSKRGMEHFSSTFLMQKKKVLRILPEVHSRPEGVVYLHDSIRSKDREKRFELDFRKYFEQLSPTERTILRMYGNHFSYREIGEQVRLSTSSVCNKVHQMISEIRNRMKKKLL